MRFFCCRVYINEKLHTQYVRSGFYHWHANAVQGSTIGGIGSTHGTYGTKIADQCLPILQTS